jgi:hypothetical protein
MAIKPLTSRLACQLDGRNIGLDPLVQNVRIYAFAEPNGKGGLPLVKLSPQRQV